MVEPVVTKIYYDRADSLKFWLMPFVCFACFGLKGHIGSYIANLSRFAAITFFVLCGFFSAESDDVGSLNSVKTLRRTTLRFFYLFAILLVSNIIFYTLGVGTPFKRLISALLHKRVLFEFIVLCSWPFNMGKSLWFIQSLFYIRVLLWLMKKLQLLKFYKLLMVIGFLAMLFTSELAGVVGFNFLGITYFPANWLTCALPNMMLGRYAYEKRAKLLAQPVSVYISGFVIGTAMAFTEFTLLNNHGYLYHMGNAVGFCVMALSLSCLFLRMPASTYTFFTAHGRSYSWTIYALSQPVALILVQLAAMASSRLLTAVQEWGGIVIYIACLLITLIFGYILFFIDAYNDSAFIRKWNRWLH